jgi:hypothetical protein
VEYQQVDIRVEAEFASPVAADRYQREIGGPRGQVLQAPIERPGKEQADLGSGDVTAASIEEGISRGQVGLQRTPRGFVPAGDGEARGGGGKNRWPCAHPPFVRLRRLLAHLF